MREEVVLPFPQPLLPARHVRTTLLLGGLGSIRAADLYDAYVAVAPPEVRTAIESAVAGMWLPIEIGVAHYAACDKLGLSADSAAQLGRGTFDRTKGLLLGTAIGLARGAGVTPWTMMPHLQRFWMRGLDGGGIRASRLGPKEARVEVVSCALFQTRYFRAATRGLLTSLLELTCQKAYVHEQPVGDQESSLTMRAQWV